MDKTYDPAAIELQWGTYWEQQGCFRPSGAGASYCIVIPPPNVTGTLHMGHAFQTTIMDALIRYHRMCGDNTLWQPGTDHAGIATQMVVERQLNAEGLTRHSLGREAFVERIWQWKARSGNAISNQLRRLGASLDWEHECFTMDAALATAVREAFVRLHDDGLIYRGKRLVNWDPVLRTAISDLEVTATEESGSLWHIRYPLVDGSGHVVVSTTRPETLLGDTAVAVHPEDPVRSALVGKQLHLPLTERIIPIIADPMVDRDFGSGFVKITPAHDFNDYKAGKRHALALINVLTEDARMNDNCPVAYQGLDRYAARERIVNDLAQLGLLQGVDAHQLMTPRGDRSNAVIEPYLTNQWFVRAAPLAAAAEKAVAAGQIRFVPGNWTKQFFEWMHNIEDWCISRQIWWGHRIPAWYAEDGTVYVARSEAEARRRYQLAADLPLEADQDVLDTWFSSALWPFSTLGWPQQTERLRTFYPTTVLVTGFDIIFFWVSRMIMFGLHFTAQAPFQEVYIHGLVRDAEGNKMSKSKGNIIDPLDLIDGIELSALKEKRTASLMQPQQASKIRHNTETEFPHGIAAYGADALRFTFCSLAAGGRDIRFDSGRIGGYRNFCNKLWNAARYVLLNTTGDNAFTDESGARGPPLRTATDTPNTIDRWILSLLAQTVCSVNQAFADYRFDMAARAMYDFIWNEYCDWYLELSKIALRATHKDASAKEGLVVSEAATRHTLLFVLEHVLRLIHPIMPFISESIWQRVAPCIGVTGHTIMHQPYPQPGELTVDAMSLRHIDWVKAFVLGIRAIRGSMDIPPSRRIPVLIENASADDRANLERFRSALMALARLERIDELSDGTPAPAAATALLGQFKLLVPLADVINKADEIERLTKKLASLERNLQRSTLKLNDPNFVNRAPPAVVAKERQRALEMIATRTEHHSQLALLQKS